jgi:hypothetical protein
MSEEYQTTHEEPRNYLDGVHTPLDPQPAADVEAFGSNHTEIERAAEELSSSREGRNPVIERAFHDGQDLTRAAPGDRSVSPEFAADALKGIRADEESWARTNADAELAKVIDDFRAGDAAQLHQPELGQVQPQQPEPQLQPQAEFAPPGEPGELDRLLAPLPPENRQAFIQNYNDLLQQTRHQASLEHQHALQHVQNLATQYENSVAQTLLTAEASALAPFPELHNIPRDQIQTILSHLARTNPNRAAEIRHHVANVKELAANQIQAAQTAWQQRQAAGQAQQAQQQENFKTWAAAQDDLLEKTSWANESPQNRNAIAREIIDHYRQYGVSERELVAHYNQNPAMRHAATQSLIADGIRYRQAQKSAQRAQVRQVPQVQRPGAASEEARDYSEVSSLQREFNLKPTARTAAALLAARRGAR